jgi:hypothetical protein
MRAFALSGIAGRLLVGFVVRVEIGFTSTFTSADRDRFERFEFRLTSGAWLRFFVVTVDVRRSC